MRQEKKFSINKGLNEYAVKKELDQNKLIPPNQLLNLEKALILVTNTPQSIHIDLPEHQYTKKNNTTSKIDKEISDASKEIWTILVNYRKNIENGIKQHREEIKKLLSLSIKILQLIKNHDRYRDCKDMSVFFDLAHLVKTSMHAYLKNRMNANSTCMYLLKKLNLIQKQAQTSAETLQPIDYSLPSKNVGNTMFNKINEEMNIAAQLKDILIAFKMT